MITDTWPPDPSLRGLQEPPAGLCRTCGCGAAVLPGVLRIGVLGTCTINGQPAAAQRDQAALLLALALARDGLAGDQLRQRLGKDPDHPRSGDAVRQLITRARQRLGSAPDGLEWVEHLGGGHYMLHPGASFDWRVFRELASRGTICPDCLRAALRLVRGQPFSGCWQWWIDEATISAACADITNAALALAQAEAAGGDPAGSAAAVRKGLAADPACEPLWRALMLAEHAMGSLGGVQDAWARCLREIASMVPGGLPHQDTIMLHHQLTTGG